MAKRWLNYCWIPAAPLLVSSILLGEDASISPWTSLGPAVYTGAPLDWLSEGIHVEVDELRYDQLLVSGSPVSFDNFPADLALSYLSLSASTQNVAGMGNVVNGDPESGGFVDSIETVLVTWARAAEWPDWAAKDPSGYPHRVTIGIFEVDRDASSEVAGFRFVGESSAWVHVPWRPDTIPGGGPYPHNGYAFKIRIPFPEKVVLPSEYCILVSYNTERSGYEPLATPGPYNQLNFALSGAPVTAGSDPEPSSLLQIKSGVWNYSPSWFYYGSIMTRVRTRSVEQLGSPSPDLPVNAGDYRITAYSGGNLIGQAVTRILPAPATVSIGNLVRFKDDDYAGPEVMTEPPGLPFEVAYEGSPLVPNAIGRHAVTVTVTSPNHEGFTSDWLQVRGPRFQKWFERHGGEAPNGQGGGVTGDMDGDGLPDLVEYCLGTKPGTRNRQPLTPLGNGRRGIGFQRLSDVPDATLHVEMSTDLRQWDPAPATAVEQGEFERVEVDTSEMERPSMYFRLRATPR